MRVADHVVIVKYKWIAVWMLAGFKIRRKSIFFYDDRSLAWKYESVFHRSELAVTYC